MQARARSFVTTDMTMLTSRTLALAAVLAVVACKQDDDGARAKGQAFLDAYAEQLDPIAKLAGKRADPAAVLVALSRALPTSPLPEAPATLAACRSDATTALATLGTVLQPAKDKANENPHVFRAIVLELEPKADAALRALRTNIESCVAQAKNAGLATTRLDLLLTSWQLGI